GLVRKAARTVEVDAVGTIQAVAQRMQRRVIVPGGAEVAVIVAVVPQVGVVGRDVGVTDVDRNRCVEGDVLPAGAGLPGKGGSGQQLPGARPEAPGVGTGIPRSLMETDPGDHSCRVGAKPDADLDGAAVTRRLLIGRRKAVPDAVRNPYKGVADGRIALVSAA